MSQRRRSGRYAIAMFVIVGVVVAFTVRLVDLQVVNAATLATDAKAHRALEVPIYGIRGDILGADGAVLADSVERYDVTVSPKVALGYYELNYPGSVERDLVGIAKATGADASDMMTKLQKNPDSEYAVLVKSLTLQQFQDVEALGVPWVYMVRDEQRTYPNGEIAGNIIGFLGTDEPLAGVERTENSCLAGKDGVLSYERSEDGVRIPGTEQTVTPAVDGGTLNLTIDRDLDWYVQQRMVAAAQQLKATWTEAAVVRISDGALLALTDYPTLDPNEFGTANPAYTGSRAFAIPYEPGSIMKPMTDAIDIDTGKASPFTHVDAPYIKNFGIAGTISDAEYHPSNLTLTGTLVYSSNTGTATVAQTVSPSVRESYLRAFGFGSPTAIDFNGESGGILAAASKWDVRQKLDIAYGQGISTTILQIASAYQTLGNGGVKLPLKLVNSCVEPDGTVVAPTEPAPQQVVSSQTAGSVLDMMEMVYEHNGLQSVLTIPGYRMAVKSGSALVAENGAYGNKMVISYGGIFPADDPQYVVVVSAGIPYKGLSTAIGSTFHDVASQVLTYYKVPYSRGKATELPILW